jgi:hypothetical protein
MGWANTDSLYNYNKFWVNSPFLMQVMSLFVICIEIRNLAIVKEIGMPALNSGFNNGERGNSLGLRLHLSVF